VGVENGWGGATTNDKKYKTSILSYKNVEYGY